MRKYKQPKGKQKYLFTFLECSYRGYKVRYDVISTARAAYLKSPKICEIRFDKLKNLWKKNKVSNMRQIKS